MFGYYKLINSLRRKLEKSDFHKGLARKSDTVVIFGNGYSIADLELSQFRNEDCFVCNEFYRFNGFGEFVESNNVTYFAMDGMSSFVKMAKRKNLGLDDVLTQYIHPIVSDEYNIVVQKSMYDYIKTLCVTDRVYVLGGDLTALLAERCRTIRISRESIKKASVVRHTPHAMILTALILGFREIHLYGLDHTYVRDILNKSPMAGKHFYLETQRQVLNTNLIFERGQFGFIKLSGLFMNNAETFKIYEAHREIADALGVQIIDMTNGSLFCFQDFDIYDLITMEENGNNVK